MSVVTDSKACTKCHEVKPLDDFHGLGGHRAHRRRPHCKNCERARARVKEARRYVERRALVDEYKLTRGCADCGYRAHPAALQFDHVRGVKLFEIGGMVSKTSLEDLMAEIDKCEVVCGNCHAVRTFERRRGA